MKQSSYFKSVLKYIILLPVYSKPLNLINLIFSVFLDTKFAYTPDTCHLWLYLWTSKFEDRNRLLDRILACTVFSWSFWQQLNIQPHFQESKIRMNHLWINRRRIKRWYLNACFHFSWFLMNFHDFELVSGILI